MKIRQGKDITLRWKITTNGEALPLEGRNLTLILSTPNGRERVLSYTTEGDIIITRLFGKEITHLGDYTLTLWENRGEQGQTAVDAVNAFELVKYTTMEEDGSPCGNLEAEVLNLSGELGVFQQGTTTEKNEQVDKNTADIADIKQGMGEVQGDVEAINITLDDLEKADASLREEIANIKDKDAEQDEEITSLLDILEGKLDIKDLGSGLRPDQAVSEIIQYVRSNEIKSALVFKYIDTDNSSTFGICISRTGTSGWIIYLVARKGLEVLKFNSRGSRETWNEYGGVLRHDMNSVADEQLECLSIKGIKSVLAKKQDALISGQNIRTINGKDILGGGNIEIETGITEEEEAEINAKIDDKAPKSGYAPDLKVNFAKELVGRGEATPEVIGGIRPTGVRSIGDGNATITKIRGESVVWNQLAGRLINQDPGLTVSSNGNLVTINGTATARWPQIGIRLDGVGSSLGGHLMYLECFKIKGNVTQGGDNLPALVEGYDVPNSRISLNEGGRKIFRMALGKPVSFGTLGSAGDVYTDYTARFIIHDLTQMFGAGKEPTTIEEFEARKPLGVSNEYNEGTIVSYDGDALKSVGFNALDCDRILVKESGKQPTSSRIWDYDKAYYPAASSGYVIGSYSVENIVITPELIQATCGSAWYGLAFPIPLIGGAEYEFTYSSLIGTIGIMYLDKEGKHTSNFSLDRNKPFIAEKDKQAVFLIVPTTNGQTISVTNPCFHLVHSGYRNGEYQPYEDDTLRLPNVESILDAEGNQLFPHGLLSAGSVYDEITATKAIKRIGVVDMGTLDWNYSNNGNWPHDLHYARIDTVPSKKSYQSILVQYSKNNNITMIADKQYVAGAGNQYIYIYDSSYTSASSFKQAMSGVLLYYELAEPIEVDLPEPLNMTYEAWDFGTEELVAKGATTPLNADIVYQFNAVDRIRENTANNEELEAKIAALEETIKQLTAQTINEGGTSNEQM